MDNNKSHKEELNPSIEEFDLVTNSLSEETNDYTQKDEPALDVTKNCNTNITIDAKKETVVEKHKSSMPIDCDDNDEKFAKSKKEKTIGFIKKLSKRWFISAFTGMAQGLFVTLIAGTIIKQIGNLIKLAGTPAGTTVGDALITVGTIASLLMGAGIGAGIAKYLKASNLTILTAMVAGMIGAFAMSFFKGNWIDLNLNILSTRSPGNPIGAYVCSLVAIEVGNLVSGKTKVDILVVPLCVIFTAIISTFIAWPFIKFIDLIAKGLEIATGEVPFVMGVLIAVSMGLLLTLPTSSAAIWISIAMVAPNSDTMLIAGGAACVGCCAHMVGFAVSSFKENKWGGLVAQGLGTSMLQIPNIMKNPIILVPQVVASAIVGPLSTVVFKLRCGATGGGMGTSGLVGILGIIDASSNVIPAWQMWLGIILLCIILPALISLGITILFRKKNLIKENDLKLSIS